MASRFILMHIFATNICVWLRVLFAETVDNLDHVVGESTFSETKNIQTTPDPGRKFMHVASCMLLFVCLFVFF